MRVLVYGRDELGLTVGALRHIHNRWGVGGIVVGDQRTRTLVEHIAPTVVIPVAWRPPTRGRYVGAEARQRLKMLEAVPDLVLLMGEADYGGLERAAMDMERLARFHGIPTGVVYPGPEIVCLGRGWGALARRLADRGTSGSSVVRVKDGTLICCSQPAAQPR